MIKSFFKCLQNLMQFWREHFPNSIYELNYEKLTQDQKSETEKLLAYCDLDWQEQCLNFHESKRLVKTSSALQVKQAMYKGSSEAWKKYKDYLQPLISKGTSD